MILTFKIYYETVVRKWFFRRSVHFKITEVAIVAENGYEYVAKGKSIAEMRIEMNVFLSEVAAALKLGKEFYCYGHYCVIEHHLLESIWPSSHEPPVVIDFQDEMIEYAAYIEDSAFTPESDYTLIINKLPQQTYLVIEKIEMIQSHSDYPVLDKSTALSYAKWIKGAMDFDVFKMWKMMVGFLSNAKKHVYGE